MLTVRPAAPSDRMGWEALWHANCAHFAADGMTPAVVEGLWRRVLDDAHPMTAWLALREAQPIGFAHTIVHPHTFTLRQVCYLEDLWVAPEARGTGAATALIDHLADVGRREGWRRLYWETNVDNAVARRLYDRIATRRATVTYQIDLEDPRQ
jgi:GNAT superfamily N-acetyltransferase